MSRLRRVPVAGGSKLIGSYAFTPHLWPLVAAASFLLVLAFYGWRRRRIPGALPFAATCLFAAAWVAGEAFELAATSPASGRFWTELQSVWALAPVTAALWFALDYAELGHWLTRRRVLLLVLVPALYLILALTNELHQLVWAHQLVIPAGLDSGSVAHSPAVVLWVALGYGYLLSLLTVAVLVWHFLSSPSDRWPVALILSGVLVTRLAHIADLFLANRLAPSSLLVPAVVLAAILYTVALFGYRMFDPAAIARKLVIDQMREAMLVMDPGGIIIDANHAAEQVLGRATSLLRGLPLSTAVPALAAALPQPEETDIIFAEVALGEEDPVAYFSSSLSTLRDKNGLLLGYLLLLHDITEERRVQAQLLEQQRLLATLEERERLARELHDSTGQVLGYVSMQAQAIGKRLRDGDAVAAQAQLVRLAGAAKEAHLDVRESIMALRSGPAESWSFLAALRHYLDLFSANYGIRTDLSILGDLSADDFGSDTGVQLLRVIQEALSNARKHSRGTCVQVTLGREDGQIRAVVADDGCGFHVAEQVNGLEGHFGLCFMRERMEQVGGTLTLESRPGRGTRVVFRVPLPNRQLEAL